MYLKYSCEGAPHGLLVPVEWQAKTDDDHADEHHESSKREAESPSLVVLHPHQEDETHEPSQRDGEGEPVEVADLGVHFRRVLAVELIAAERCRTCAH